jgi:hypothetical protein
LTAFRAAHERRPFGRKDEPLPCSPTPAHHRFKNSKSLRPCHRPVPPTPICLCLLRRGSKFQCLLIPTRPLLLAKRRFLSAHIDEIVLFGRRRFSLAIEEIGPISRNLGLENVCASKLQTAEPYQSLQRRTMQSSPVAPWIASRSGGIRCALKRREDRQLFAKIVAGV